MMKQSGLQFTEDQLLMILQGLGSKGCWGQALGVVQYVFDEKKKSKSKSKSRYFICPYGVNVYDVEEIGLLLKFNIMEIGSFQNYLPN